ncbi:MAG TPA: tetratricopeptide repeat protein [Methyloceanibacter sp.]|nr:tetratricopeptide repeat protein [Methyloceanibacter sp.]
MSNRAAIYADQRAYERALEDNNRVVELEPDQAAGYVARGLTYARRGDFEYALRDFDRAITLDAKSALPISTADASISARAIVSALFVTIARR